ncbi:MAG: hypothetical protein ACO21B_10280, partial [Gemmobacter sp.]
EGAVSNPDSFIDEVTEEVRRDRLYGVLRRYGWIGVLLVVLVVGGAAWREWAAARDAAAARALGDALHAAIDAPDAATRAAALAGLGTSADQRALAALIGAVMVEPDADPAAREAAMAALEAAAAAPGVDPIWTDLALLRRVTGGTLDPAARRAALAPLIVPGRPLRTLAEEHLALADLEAGDVAGARARLEALAGDAETPQAQRRRLMRILTALGPADAAAGGGGG